MICPPRVSLPTCTTTSPPTKSGEAAVPQKSFDVSTAPEKSLPQRRRPVAASQAVTTPVVPTVKRRAPATSGVAFGPFAIFTAYWFF